MNFLGTTPPLAVLQSVIFGTQTTSALLFGLIALVGIPLAFEIGKMVVDFIKDAVSHRSGYYETHGAGEAAEYAPDQEAARERYNIQETGMTGL